ncbi:GroES-like protein [Dendrothele bispora CBS 962.96]|uniref:GroES-like protein n=1 Tax=Dendrothele bispora (strain CBS 962.96) TaxID=1314807 RepID=A0A4S8KNK6_DENBC|nr:GroES-like protein [Dendrothele bispora CBS 962.96]
MSQKALLMHSKHSPFELTTIPKPISAPRGELVVKIQASALNPADWKYQEYGWLDKYPGTVGFDIAGYQQYTLVPADIVGKIPAKLSYSQASTIAVGFNTAAVGLYAKAPIGLGLNPDLEPGIER